MPANVVKSLADKSGESIERVEELWDKAQEIVTSEYNITKESDKFYPLVTGILKKMLKITSEDADASITTSTAGLGAGQDGAHYKYMGMVKRNDKKQCKKCKNEKCKCTKNEGFTAWLHKGE